MTKNIRVLENFHIPLWLIKDACWMFHWKLIGVTMIAPTLAVSLLIVFITRKSNDVFINAAISFWISANAFWMCAEFFAFEQYKELAAIPFSCGFLFVIIFYLRAKKTKNEEKNT
jgi:hypothetical protein